MLGNPSYAPFRVKELFIKVHKNQSFTISIGTIQSQSVVHESSQKSIFHCKYQILLVRITTKSNVFLMDSSISLHSLYRHVLAVKLENLFTFIYWVVTHLVSGLRIECSSYFQLFSYCPLCSGFCPLFSSCYPLYCFFF